MLRFGHVSAVHRIARRARPWVALALVASLVTTLLGPLVHADDGHDADFASAVVHDASQHRLTSGTPHPVLPAVEQHCVACHLVRLVRENPTLALSTEPILHSAGLRSYGNGHALSDLSGPPLPARAPPVSLLA
jgi:hypothetical protein